VSNAFDRNRRLLHRNGAVMSPLDAIPAVAPSPPCPRCRAPMWLSRLEPHATRYDSVDDITFQCACAEQLTRTEAR